MVKTFQEIIDFIRTLYSKPEGIIHLHEPVFTGNEKKYINECIDSGYVSSVGKFVDQFEEKIVEYTGAKRAVVCVNGTNALHIALILVGVERNTEVITQPLTFVATTNAIAYCGAYPVFLDVDMDTMGLSPDAIIEWLEFSTIKKIDDITNIPVTINKTTGRRIAACVPMHTFGHPCRIDKIVEICKEYNIPVVEDAAESLGSLYKEKHTGCYGTVGVLSFNGNKIVTTGGGGMLLFQDESLASRAKHLTTQAKVQHPWEFAHDEIGYNYRMPNLNAALGLAQLEQLPLFLHAKRQIASAYGDFFSSLSAGLYQPITFFEESDNARSNYWLNCILFANQGDRDAFLCFSNATGIMTRPAWQLMNRLIMFKDSLTDELTNSKDITDRLVSLPSGVSVKYLKNER